MVLTWLNKKKKKQLSLSHISFRALDTHWNSYICEKLIKIKTISGYFADNQTSNNHTS